MTINRKPSSAAKLVSSRPLNVVNTDFPRIDKYWSLHTPGCTYLYISSSRLDKARDVPVRIDFHYRVTQRCRPRINLLKLARLEIEHLDGLFQPNRVGMRLKRE